MTRQPLGRNGEANIQASILELLRLQYPDVIAASIPNGGYLMAPRAVQRLKWQGLLPGMPDLILIWTGGWALVEVKVPGGVVSDAQRALIPLLEARGCRVAIWRSIDDAIRGLAAWGVPTRAQARAAQTLQLGIGLGEGESRRKRLDRKGEGAFCGPG